MNWNAGKFWAELTEENRAKVREMILGILAPDPAHEESIAKNMFDLWETASKNACADLDEYLVPNDYVSLMYEGY